MWRFAICSITACRMGLRKSVISGVFDRWKSWQKMCFQIIWLRLITIYYEYEWCEKFRGSSKCDNIKKTNCVDLRFVELQHQGWDSGRVPFQEFFNVEIVDKKCAYKSADYGSLRSITNMENAKKLGVVHNVTIIRQKIVKICNLFNYSM